MSNDALISLAAEVLGLGDGEPASLAAVVTTTAAGVMTPLHVHDRAEAHHVLEGLLTVNVGDDVVVLGPGQSLVAPAHVPHTHRAERRTRHVAIATAASVSRYEDWLRAVARPVPAFSWEHGAEAAALAAIGSANGIAVLGPPGAISDCSWVLARAPRT